MIDPLGPLASIATLTNLASKGFQAILRQQPEYHHFWTRFEHRLKPQARDLPWSRIEDHYRLNPEFIAAACHLIRGHVDRLEEAEASFRAQLVPPEGSRYNQDEMVAEVMEATREAATHAVQDFKQAFTAQTITFEERIGGLQTTIQASTADLSHRVGASSDQIGEVQNQLTRLNDQLASDRQEGRLSLARVRRAQPEGATRETGSSDTEPVWDLAVEADPDASTEELIAALAHADPAAAAQLRSMISEGGEHAVVAALRSESGPGDRSVEYLACAARIAGGIGAFEEAETAFVWASQVEGLGPDKKARQLVRASSMASIRSEDRARELVAEAKALVPDHPSVAIAEARASRDPEWALQRLAGTEGETDLENALLHASQAQAYLRLGQESQARAQLDLARQVGPARPAAQELEGLLTLMVAKRQARTGEEVDAEALGGAGETFQSLRPALEQQGRWDDSASVCARAAEVFALARRFDEAGFTLEGVKRSDQLGGDVLLDLGQAAMAAQRPDLTLRFLPDDAGSPARLLRAEANSFAEDATVHRHAVEALIGLLDSDEQDVARHAAGALLNAAGMHADVEWNERAEATILAAMGPVSTAMLRAGYFRERGDLAAAEQALLTHAGNPSVLRLLRDIAALHGDWQKARDRSRGVMQSRPSENDQLAEAKILLSAGEVPLAKDRFLSLARNSDACAETRDAAYSEAVGILSDAQDFAEVRRSCEEWRQALPQSENAVWNLLWALQRMSEWEAAYALYQEADPQPSKLIQSRLVGVILNRAAPAQEAVEKLKRLSEKLDSPDEHLEGLLISTGLQAEQTGVALPEEMSSEVGKRLRAFIERFPDSDLMRAVSFPTTPEGIDALMREMHGPSAEAQEEALKQIAAGQSPLNLLAVVSPVSQASAAWGKQSILPLGFAMRELDDSDRAAAREAIGGAAVWDPSSIVVAGGLGPDLEQAIRSALPGSMIANETRDDADAAAAGLPGGTGELGFDPRTGRAYARDVPAEERERDRLRAEGVLRIARDLPAEAAGGKGSDERLVETLRDVDQDSAWKPLVATVLLAERTDRPIYSDDRWIRAGARAEGLRSFGTPALLDALEEKAIITRDQRRLARARLAASGGWGLSLTADEMVAAAAANDWDLTPALAGAFRDRAAWRSGVAERWDVIVEFLQRVFEERPDLLRVWTARAIDAATDAVPTLDGPAHTMVMLVMAWDLDPQTRVSSAHGFHALVHASRSLPAYLQTPGRDPVISAMVAIISMFVGRSDRLVAAVFWRCLSRLPFPEQQRAWDHFVD